MIYMVRHGETVLTPMRKFSGVGPLNPELTEKGLSQAAAVAGAIAKLNPEVFIASPFIASALRKLQRESGCEYENINVLIYKQKEEQKSPNLYFFNGTTPVKPITMDFIFGDMFGEENHEENRSEDNKSEY
jgi:hypothetical protein